jgi:hypothetical protein
MNIHEAKITASVLFEEVGWSWPLLMARCLRRKNDIFKQTHWSKEKSPEVEYVKRLPIVSAAFLELQEMYPKDRAFGIMRKVIVPIGLNETMKSLRALDVSGGDPLEKLIDYLDFIDEEGSGRFCNREYAQKDSNRCHRVVTKCPFHGFFIEAGTPALTQLFCEVDIAFYTQAFPELDFHRGGSWENTIAYGKDHCDFVFERKLS